MNVFYGICGEGLGHTGRSLAVIRRLLADKHQVDVFTYGMAYDFLLDHVDKRCLHRVEGFRFGTKTNGIASLSTLLKFWSFLKKVPDGVQSVIEEALVKNAGLFITDMEPILPRAAKLLKIPCVSIDNQHRFLRSQEALPVGLKTYCAVAGAFLRYYIPSTTINLVSVFHKENRSAEDNIVYVGPIIRDEIIKATPTDKGFVLVYIKPYMGGKILSVLNELNDVPFVVYGVRPFSATNNITNITVKFIGDESFVEDLASCRAVIATAGNQLIGEASYLGKPILVIPVPRQTEQAVNAHYVHDEGIGSFCRLKNLTPSVVKKFLCDSKDFKPIPRGNGIDLIMEQLGRFL